MDRSPAANEWLDRAKNSKRQYTILAGISRKLHNFLNFLQVVCAALIAVSAAITSWPFGWDGKIVAASLGATVAIAKGLDSSFGLRTGWMRAASTRQQLIDLRLSFETRIGVYHGLPDDDAVNKFGQAVSTLIEGEYHSWQAESSASTS